VIPGTHEVLVPSWSPKQGLVGWRNHNGIYVLQAHYSADPAKTAQWAAEAAKLFPGGMAGKQWQAENEIDWFARSGGKVFEDFALGTHVCKPFEIPENWLVFRGLDYGFRNPTACVWVAVDGDGEAWVFKEYYVSGRSVAEHATAIKGATGRMKVQFSVIDPSTQARTQANTLSVYEQFAREGLYFTPGDNRVIDGISAMQEMMRIHEFGRPLLHIFSTCPGLISELQGYRWMMQSDGANNARDPREAPVKKNDHGVDALRYVIMSSPSSYVGKARVDHRRPELTVHERVERQVAIRRWERIVREEN
jgi:hypothetical protein